MNKTNLNARQYLYIYIKKFPRIFCMGQKKAKSWNPKKKEKKRDVVHMDYYNQTIISNNV